MCEYLQELLTVESNVKSSIMAPRHNTCQRISITFSIVILIKLGSCIHTVCYVKILHISYYHGGTGVCDKKLNLAVAIL